MHVEAVEKRPRYLRAIACDSLRRTSTPTCGVSQITARTRIHCRDQLEARREFDLLRGARHCDVTVLERLAQHFQYFTVVLGKLIEKQNAVVSERDLTGPRNRTATH